MSYGVPDALAKTQRTRDGLTYPTIFPNDFLRVPAFQKSNYKDLNEIVFILTFLFAGGTSRKKIPLPFIFQFPPPEKQLRRQEKKKRKKWAWWLISRCLYGELVVLDVVFYRRRARNAKIVDDALRQRLLLPTDRWFPSKQNKKSRTNNKRVPAIFQEITQLLTSFVVSLLQPVPTMEPTTLARPKGSSFTTKGEHSGLKWASANGHWPYTGHHNVNANRGWWLKLLNMQVARKSIRHFGQ